MKELNDAKLQLSHIKAPKIDVEPRYRMKGKSGSAKKFKRKQKMVETNKREYIKEKLDQKAQLNLSNDTVKNKKSYGPVLDRFLSKNKS